MNLSMLVIPVLFDTTTQPFQLVNQWVRMYHYGHHLYPGMAITTCLLYGYAAFSKHAAGRHWRVFVVAAATTLSMLPFTWIFMTRTNNALFRAQMQSEAGRVASWDEAQELVTTWGRLHFVRSLLPLTGAVLGLLGNLHVLAF